MKMQQGPFNNKLIEKEECVLHIQRDAVHRRKKIREARNNCWLCRKVFHLIIPESANYSAIVVILGHCGQTIPGQKPKCSLPDTPDLMLMSPKANAADRIDRKIKNRVAKTHTDPASQISCS